jgi:hypothetical protein
VGLKGATVKGGIYTLMHVVRLQKCHKSRVPGQYIVTGEASEQPQVSCMYDENVGLTPVALDPHALNVS